MGLGATLATISVTARRSKTVGTRLASCGLNSVVGDQVATDPTQLTQEREQLEREKAVLAERLAPLEATYRRAEAFQLPEREALDLEVRELQCQLEDLSRRLEAIPAPKKEVFRVLPPAALAPLSAEAEAERKASLRRLDGALQLAVAAEIGGQPLEAVRNEEAKAVDLLRSELSSCLRGFGTSEFQVTKREFTLQEMKDSGVDTAKLLSPKDSILDNLRKVFLATVALGGAAALLAFHISPGLVFFLGFCGFLLALTDQVVNRGFVELLLLDTISRLFSSDYKKRVAQHEAGHFLVAYLLGILPKAYTLSAWEAFSKFNSINTQAGCVFCDSDIQQEVQSGKLSGNSLDRFVCIALGGVSTEYLLFDQAEGGMSDIQQLELLFQSLKFDQRQTNAQLRWAVMNTIGLLKRNTGTHAALTEAMLRGASVGECVSVIEGSLASSSEESSKA